MAHTLNPEDFDGTNQVETPHGLAFVDQSRSGPWHYGINTVVDHAPYRPDAIGALCRYYAERYGTDDAQQPAAPDTADVEFEQPAPEPEWGTYEHMVRKVNEQLSKLAEEINATTADKYAHPNMMAEVIGSPTDGRGFCIGNALKYINRYWAPAGKKTCNPADLRKAARYLLMEAGYAYCRDQNKKGGWE